LSRQLSAFSAFCLSEAVRQTPKTKIDLIPFLGLIEEVHCTATKLKAES
jgi:hypothetical protein